MLLFTCSVMSNPLRPHRLQHARPPCPSLTPGVYSNSCPLSWWCHPIISSSVVPSPPALNPSQHQSLFRGVNSSHEVAKVLEFQFQHHSLQRNPRADLLENIRLTEISLLLKVIYYMIPTYMKSLVKSRETQNRTLVPRDCRWELFNEHTFSFAR